MKFHTVLVDTLRTMYTIGLRDEIRTYMYLRARAIGGRIQKEHSNLEALCKAINVSRPTAIKHLKTLSSHKLLAKVPAKGKNAKYQHYYCLASQTKWLLSHKTFPKRKTAILAKNQTTLSLFENKKLFSAWLTAAFLQDQIESLTYQAAKCFKSIPSRRPKTSIRNLCPSSEPCNVTSVEPGAFQISSSFMASYLETSTSSAFRMLKGSQIAGLTSATQMYAKDINILHEKGLTAEILAETLIGNLSKYKDLARLEQRLVRVGNYWKLVMPSLRSSKAALRKACHNTVQVEGVERPKSKFPKTAIPKNTAVLYSNITFM